MRARLLDATIETILEDGWVGTSTSKICERAGVTRGAQTHHFPSKSDLLMAAAHENSERYKQQIMEVGDTSESAPIQMQILLEKLWNASLDEKFVRSWMEVVTAARTDDEIRSPIRQLDAAGIESLRTLGRLYSEPASSIDLERVIELSVYLLRGMVIQNGLHNNYSELQKTFKVWCEMVELVMKQ